MFQSRIYLQQTGFKISNGCYNRSKINFLQSTLCATDYHIQILIYFPEIDRYRENKGRRMYVRFFEIGRNVDDYNANGRGWQGARYQSDRFFFFSPPPRIGRRLSPRPLCHFFFFFLLINASRKTHLVIVIFRAYRVLNYSLTRSAGRYSREGDGIEGSHKHGLIHRPGNGSRLSNGA